MNVTLDAVVAGCVWEIEVLFFKVLIFSDKNAVSGGEV